MDILKDLLEKRDAAHAAYEADASEYRGLADEAVTDERTAAYEAARDAVVKLDARIDEVRAEAKRAAELDEIRSELTAGVPTGDGVVRSEPRTYGPGSSHSYFRDMALSALPGRPEYQDAVMRLTAHGNEVVRDAINDSEFRTEVIRKGREHFRADESRARKFEGELEARAMSTSAGSGGQFVTPVYLVEDYAPWRQYGRVFIDQANHQDLPDYGMTVYIPAVQGPAGVAAQGGDNNGVTETDPTTGYLSSNLTTEAGQVTISQQLLDRAGPGIQFDRIVFDQLHRNYNKVINAAILTAALASAGTVANSTTPNTGALYAQALLSDVAKAQAQMETLDGTVMSPTHFFATGTQWAFATTWVDSTGRPLLVPSANGPFNALAAAIGGSSVKPTPEGLTNYELIDVPVYKDNGIALSSGHQQMVLAHMPEVYVWEGSLVTRSIPQTYAQNLSVLLQVYAYYTVIVRYVNAVQSISGSAWAGTPSWIEG
jgi:HK97 family phage major capsid protein